MNNNSVRAADITQLAQMPGVESPFDKSEWIAVAELCTHVAKSIKQAAFFNWSYASVLDELATSQTLLLKLGTKPVAALLFRTYPDRFEIMALAADQQYGRSGFATRLTKQLLIIAAERRLPVSLEVHENNQQAVNFYLKNQFKVIRVRKSYYSDGGSALVMQAAEAGNIQS